MRSPTCVLLFFVGLLAGQRAVAQQTDQLTTRQWQSWYIAEERVDILPRWQLRLELETDRNGLWSTENQTQARLLGLYELSNRVRLGAGIAYFTQEADSLTAFDDPLGTEIRPHQEVILSLNEGKTNWESRFRLEERFLQDDLADIADDAYSFNFRLRLRVEASRTLWKPHDTDRGTLRAVVNNEVMINAGRQTSTVFNQNRAYAGLNYALSEQFEVEAGYMKVIQQRSSGNAFWNRDVLRLTLIHAWRTRRAEQSR